MLTIREYALCLKPSFNIVGIPDGWRPLSIRESSASDIVILVALVDTDAKEEAEVFRFIYQGQDIGALQKQEGVELAFLGNVQDGTYLFLDVKPDLDVVVARKQGRPAIF